MQRFLGAYRGAQSQNRRRMIHRRVAMDGGPWAGPSVVHLRVADPVGQRSHEGAKEIVCDLEGAPTESTGSHLGQLPTHLYPESITKNGFIPIVLQRDMGNPFGNAGRAALSISGQPVAYGRLEVRKLETGGEGCLYRPDFGEHPAAQLGLRLAVQIFATRHASLQDLGITQGLPHWGTRRRNTILVHKFNHLTSADDR